MDQDLKVKDRVQEGVQVDVIPGNSHQRKYLILKVIEKEKLTDWLVVLEKDFALAMNREWEWADGMVEMVHNQFVFLHKIAAC
jgi:hypothetical protein